MQPLGLQMQKFCWMRSTMVARSMATLPGAQRGCMGGPQRQTWACFPNAPPEADAEVLGWMRSTVVARSMATLAGGHSRIP